jgi:hypothetical protein
VGRSRPRTSGRIRDGCCPLGRPPLGREGCLIVGAILQYRAPAGASTHIPRPSYPGLSSGAARSLLVRRGTDSIPGSAGRFPRLQCRAPAGISTHIRDRATVCWWCARSRELATLFRRGNDSIPGSARRFPLNPPASATFPETAAGLPGGLWPEGRPVAAVGDLVRMKRSR